MIEKYYSRMTLDFQTNKKIAEDVAIIPSKRLRNKIAGFATHLMKRIQRGPVRGISLKLQEEERERRMDFVPEESAIKTDVIEVFLRFRNWCLRARLVQRQLVGWVTALISQLHHLGSSASTGLQNSEDSISGNVDAIQLNEYDRDDHCKQSQCYALLDI